MANFIFNKAKEGLANGSLDLDTSVLRVLAARDTSAGTPTADDDHLDDLLSSVLTEITASGYSRQTLASASVTKNDTDDRAEADYADVNFGNVATGQTVKGYLVYQQVGGDDATPATDVNVAWIDTDSVGAFADRDGGGIVLGGGALQIAINAAGLINID